MSAQPHTSTRSAHAAGSVGLRPARSQLSRAEAQGGVGLWPARIEPDREAVANASTTAPPPAALTIRRATRDDLVPLAFFYDTCLRRDYFFRRGQLAEILDGLHHTALIAEIDGILVGVAITTAGCRLVNLLVHPAYRGLQIGRALVTASDATEVRVKRNMSTGDPLRFYRKLGFVKRGGRNAAGTTELLVRPTATESAQPPDAPRRHPNLAARRFNGRRASTTAIHESQPHSEEVCT